MTAPSFAAAPVVAVKRGSTARLIEQRPMKLHGYPISAADAKDLVPDTLAEVTLEATPDELRLIAKFLNRTASEMEKMGAAFEHVHLGDEYAEFQNSPHLVIFRGA